jgi:hypothetical protein
VCRDLRSRAVACIDQALPLERGQRFLVDRVPLALPNQRRIRNETEPRQIIEDRLFVLRPAATAVVVFDAEQHAPAQHTRAPPDVDRVDDMSKMEIARGRWREPADGSHHLVNSTTTALSLDLVVQAA